MEWIREYFWVLVIVGILLVSGIISAIMICVCRTQLSRGLSRRIQQSFAVRRKVEKPIEDNRVYLENTLYHRSGDAPPPPIPSRIIITESKTNPSHTTMERQRYANEFSLPDKMRSDCIEVLSEEDENDYDDTAMPGTVDYEHEIRRM
ncbi:SLP adapter and CSK-interacting membrane protein isoform X2 [Microcaecilia unicolor]|uniref:SLP adapter and CSK-interacting membrane protein isoform X2 n=1 Tax=Microcaecilia unicolor TaxID=1415580 RepID=A0A6P7WMS4_9AMPH|nr:SLP adapter and CSK-interacting membrane protein isoform X2 [Microcaecilia unicolor]